MRANHRRKRVQQESFCKEGSNRTGYLQVKKYMIMNDVFRNRIRKYDRVSDIVSGLVLEDNEFVRLVE
jgi:hypothetical protein